MSESMLRDQWEKGLAEGVRRERARCLDVLTFEGARLAALALRYAANGDESRAQQALNQADVVRVLAGLLAVGTFEEMLIASESEGGTNAPA